MSNQIEPQWLCFHSSSAALTELKLKYQNGRFGRLALFVAPEPELELELEPEPGLVQVDTAQDKTNLEPARDLCGARHAGKLSVDHQRSQSDSSFLFPLLLASY